MPSPNSDKEVDQRDADILPVIATIDVSSSAADVQKESMLSWADRIKLAATQAKSELVNNAKHTQSVQGPIKSSTNQQNSKGKPKEPVDRHRRKIQPKHRQAQRSERQNDSSTSASRPVNNSQAEDQFHKIAKKQSDIRPSIIAAQQSPKANLEAPNSLENSSVILPDMDKHDSANQASTMNNPSSSTTTQLGEHTETRQQEARPINIAPPIAVPMIKLAGNISFILIFE